MTVIERDPEWSVYGVGITQQSNVIRAMHQLGVLDDYLAAGFGFDAVEVFAPDGTLDRKVMLPFPAPTMPCFAGPDMKTLYVTSLAKQVDGHDYAGTIVSFAVDVPGAPVARFGEPLA